ncbi:FecR domain-containing protein [Sphingomonas sp. HF-S4]|uniref:FecR domain-containing protein n=1 Tax=Sphingomonas agrestis TaxID=3080540 RepID=A0ABU3YCN2_9SPHN|nr:FecR domain-containing protein [Sphingomonas sp. HF-S4]MDV3459135.1 FecR domain-containing protein [Sphingomonas sp. HF-S4]
MTDARSARDCAADWIIAREQGAWSDRDQQALDAWLDESDLNKAAFWRLEHSWREADRIAALGSGLAPARASAWRLRPRTWTALTALAASIAAIVGVGFHEAHPGGEASTATATFATEVGGHQSLGLSDGSRVELNTDTKMRAAIGADRRAVWLDKGEAFFEVAHRDGLPFVVHAGPREITVLGTKFSVRRVGDKVTVWVREGRVRVDNAERAGAARSAIVTAGGGALSDGAATLVTSTSPERVEQALSWREGMLSFDHERLGDIALEFNRYNRKKIVVDSEAGGIRIGGTFPALKPVAFARLLRDAYALEIEETDGAIKIRK